MHSVSSEMQWVRPGGIAPAEPMCRGQNAVPPRALPTCRWTVAWGENYEGCGDPATSSWQSVWMCRDAPHVVMLIATGARVSLCSSAQSAWRLSDVATAATDLNYLGRSVRGMRSACGWAQLAFPAEPSSMCARQESSCVARSAPDDRGSVFWLCGHSTLPVCMHPFAGLQTTGTCKQTARC